MEEELKTTLDEEKMAIILSANLSNYERLLTLESFKDFLKEQGLRADLYSITKAQLQALKAINAGLIDEDKLEFMLKKLASIFPLKDLLQYVKEASLKINKKEIFFSSNEKLNEINLSLQALSDEHTKKELIKASSLFAKLNFSVAITGVMNAGKSSLLNALLKTKLLAVSNIPETANLTIIKYGDKKASIYFWTKAEFENIENKPNFSIDINDYIKEKGFCKDIALDELKYYASAKNEISFLIKKIELFTKLDFCKDGVSIVDTPGLDDVIYQRELISRAYIKRADFLIHLMNASQALSTKDLDFLVYSLSDSRVAKFLIVLTKSDLLNEDQLEDAIIYSKKRLKQRLKELYLDEALLNKLDFLSISSKLASDFYEQKAPKQSLEASNIPKLERYLFNNLFSNEKSKLALNSYKKELILNAKNLIKKTSLEKSLINKKLSNKAFDNEKANLELKKTKLALIKDELNSIKINDQKEFLENSLILLAKKIKDRLIDELKYLEQNKKTMDKNRLESMIDIGFKDGLSDILRGLKYRFFKEIQDIKEALSLKYDFLKDDFDSGFEEFKKQMQEAIDKLLENPNFKEQKKELIAFLASAKAVSIEQSLLIKCQDILNSFKLEDFLEKLELSKDFKSFLSQKLNRYEEKELKELKELENLLKNLGDDELNSIKYIKDLEKKLEKLNKLLKELEFDKKIIRS